ncbi:PAS domain-containing protein [Maribius pontilimi]|uniref:histidine kinase n=1 Tax=Palleronia pontilimi TaxID=1964209 RepID=A0A934IH92_9RHOB|nr:PAS domain-containing protein [Palleronia pontilimi]MBJ3763360.1 PAS domain-containing protein [Palleronia pontilimi]
MSAEESGYWSRQDELQEAVSKLPVAMVLTNPNLPDNPIIYVNRAFEEVTYYSSEFAVGRNCRFLQGPDTDPADVAKLRDAIAAGRDVSLDLVNHRADGSPFQNRLVIAPIFDDNDELEAFIGIQKEIHPELETKAEGRGEQDDMLRELQHRVKNHLAMIVGMIRMQAKREISRESLQSLSHRIQSLALLYEELSPAGVASHGQQTVPAGAYLSRVATTIAALDGRSSIRVNVDCEEVDLPTDLSARLGLMLTEFLTNALEHAFPNDREGVVRVRFQRLTGDAVRLVVEDDGVGMPEDSEWPKNAPTLKEARADLEAEAEDGILDAKTASGIGGSIALGLARSIGGTIDVSRGTIGTVVTLDVDLSQGPS